MFLFDSLRNNLQTNSDWLNFVGILFTAILSFYIFKKETSIAFTRERYEKIIFPLFNILEPVLYQKVQPEYFEIALQIIKENKSLADGKLLELSYYCTKYPSQKNFNQLCTYVDRLYDKSCRRLGLRTRSISYRITRHQYKHWSYFFFYMLSLTLLSIIVILISLSVSLILMAYWVSLLENASHFNQFILPLLSTFFALALFKYIEKHF